MEQNLNLYQIFYEVAGCRNFSVAAKKLYITLRGQTNAPGYRALLPLLQGRLSDP